MVVAILHKGKRGSKGSSRTLLLASEVFQRTAYPLSFSLFSISISPDILSVISQLFPALFLALSFAIWYQASFLTFARFLWIEVSLHIAERTALQPATSAAKI